MKLFQTLLSGMFLFIGASHHWAVALPLVPSASEAGEPTTSSHAITHGEDVAPIQGPGETHPEPTTLPTSAWTRLIPTDSGSQSDAGSSETPSGLKATSPVPESSPTAAPTTAPTTPATLPPPREITTRIQTSTSEVTAPPAGPAGVGNPKGSTAPPIAPCPTVIFKERSDESTDVRTCSTYRMVKIFLIIIACMAFLLTAFMASTVALCVHVSKRKHKSKKTPKKASEEKELMCISKILPEMNGAKWMDDHFCNRVLEFHPPPPLDEPIHDEGPFSTFLPENDKLVQTPVV